MVTAPIRPEELERDLGFGAVVSRESELRLLNRDGTFNLEREGIGFWQTLNLYHVLLDISWPRFFALVALFYCIINALFALAYVACGPGALQGDIGTQNAFARAFFFSVETSSTLGYGNIVPVGHVPNLLMALEVLVAIIMLAVVTGVVFARFSRPTAKILYSRQAVIAPFQGGQAFMFRVVNARKTQIVELKAKVIFSRFENVKGERMRQYYPLELERPSVVFFPMAWTIVHPITDSSPLHGLSQDEMRSSRGEFLILLTGTDETFSDVVHSRSSYIADEIAWNARFRSMFTKPQGDRKVSIDLRRFHAIEPAS
jgi:inward rectifier potassium channel